MAQSLLWRSSLPSVVSLHDPLDTSVSQRQDLHTWHLNHSALVMGFGGEMGPRSSDKPTSDCKMQITGDPERSESEGQSRSPGDRGGLAPSLLGLCASSPEQDGPVTVPFHLP